MLHLTSNTKQCDTFTLHFATNMIQIFWRIDTILNRQCSTLWHMYKCARWCLFSPLITSASSCWRTSALSSNINWFNTLNFIYYIHTYVCTSLALCVLSAFKWLYSINNLIHLIPIYLWNFLNLNLSKVFCKILA